MTGRTAAVRTGWRRYSSWLRLVAVSAALVLLVAVLVDGVRSVDRSAVDLKAVAVALVASGCAWLSLAASWSMLSVGRAKGAMGDWYATQIYRYLPGGVWAPIARGGTVTGRPARKASLVVLEAGVMATSAAAVAGLLMASRWPLAAGALVALVVPVVVARFILSAAGVEMSSVMRAQALSIVGFLFFAVAGMASQVGVGSDLTCGDTAVVAGASVASWLAGFVVVVAPSGAGVRELTYIALFGAVVDDGLGSAGVTLHRLTGVVAEIVVFTVGVGAHGVRARRRSDAVVNR